MEIAAGKESFNNLNKLLALDRIMAWLSFFLSFYLLKTCIRVQVYK